jgi:hypothetical protein
MLKLNKDIEREAHGRAAKAGYRGKTKCRMAGYEAEYEKSMQRRPQNIRDVNGAATTEPK